MPKQKGRPCGALFVRLRATERCRVGSPVTQGREHHRCGRGSGRLRSLLRPSAFGKFGPPPAPKSFDFQKRPKPKDEERSSLEASESCSTFFQENIHLPFGYALHQFEKSNLSNGAKTYFMALGQYHHVSCDPLREIYRDPRTQCHVSRYPDQARLSGPRDVLCTSGPRSALCCLRHE